MNLQSDHPQAMLTELYIEALRVDEDLADQVWQLWHASLVSDELAAVAWWLIVLWRQQSPYSTRSPNWSF